MTTLQILHGIVAAKDLELIQLDVKTNFVHSDLKEEIKWSSWKALLQSAKNISFAYSGIVFMA